MTDQMPFYPATAHALGCGMNNGRPVIACICGLPNKGLSEPGAVTDQMPPKPLKRGTRDHAYWLADKIPAFGDYGKECAETLRTLADRLTEAEAMVEELKDGPFSESWEEFRSQCASAIVAKDATLDALTRELEEQKALYRHDTQVLSCLGAEDHERANKAEATIAAQAERIKHLEATIARGMGGDYLSLQALYIQQLNEAKIQFKRIKALEESLEFYADPLCCTRSQMIFPRPHPEADMVCDGPSPAEVDNGDEARAALAHKEAQG